MKNTRSLIDAGRLLAALMLIPTAALQAQAPAGGGRGGGGGAAMTPSQTAAVGAIGALVQSQSAAVTSARNALAEAALRNDQAAIRAGAEALASAELALANSRSSAFSLLQSTPDRLSAAQIQTWVQSLNAPAAAPAAGGGGGRGGGGGGGLNLAGGPNISDYADRMEIFAPAAPVLPQSPAEQLKEFILPQGYSMELVLDDPIIQEPTAVAFDGNGRMFVLQDRGYMKTIDAQRQRDPIGQISLHEDTNNDGVYDKHSVFVDNLVFPRFVTPFGPNSILTMETDQGDVWRYTDTDNNGVADKKELFTTGMGRSGNVEHQPSFLTWTMDNWMYSAYNSVRIRWTADRGVLREAIGTGTGQWGVTQDNDGRQWIQGGSSGVPAYWQFPIYYGAIDIPNNERWDPDFTIPWGAPVRIADMQPGLASVRMPDGTLNRVTGAAGSDIVRAHRMPADLQGHYLYGEPVARIVRRIEPVTSEGVTTLKNHYKWNEFIKSTDPLFRPVDMATAPDGTVYIVDMYRGIIQEATWSAPTTTYLRARVDQYQLDKVHSLGRVWRVKYTGLERDRTVPRMNNESAAQLVGRLSHANGWWRDTAQQLLILKQDKSVVPALERLARTSNNTEARMHAIWTLEGLGSLTPQLARDLQKDANPRVKVQAIRASETLYKAGNRTFAADWAALAKDKEPSVAIQALLTMNTLKVADAAKVAQEVQAANQARGVRVVTNAILSPAAAAGGGRGATPTAITNATPAIQASLTRGKETYDMLCSVCHAKDGMGEPKPDNTGLLAPALAASVRVNGHQDYILHVLLRGLSGPIPGTAFNDIMVPMGENSDQWIADVANYVRISIGNYPSAITPEHVARVRAATASQTRPYTFNEVMARIPQQITSIGEWKVTTSHNEATARQALSYYNTWTGAGQGQPIWYQIELPTTSTVAEVQFTVSAGGAGGRGGGGGRGGAAAPGGRGIAPAVGNAAEAPAPLPAAAPVAAAAPAPAGQSRNLRIEVSTNGTTWTPAAQAQVENGENILQLNSSTPVKFVRIAQDAGGPNLGLQALRLFERPTSSR